MESYKLKKYWKKDPFSYTFGIFPTIELLTHKKENVIKILLSSKCKENEGLKKITTLCKMNNISYEINDKIIERISPRENNYVIGIFNKYTQDDIGIYNGNYSNHITLVNPSDMGNLGTILRTIAGFGYKTIAIIKPSADLFNPKVIRASMGSIFQLNIVFFDDINTYLNTVNNGDSNCFNLYPLMTNGETRLKEADLVSPYALIFGNESSGLPEYYHTLGNSLNINHTNSIDSLNLSIAVGITLYEASGRKCS